MWCPLLADFSIYREDFDKNVRKSYIEFDLIGSMPSQTEVGKMINKTEV